jgi:hypothetical protein
MGEEALHKRAHFRRIREVMIEIAKYEKFDTRDFNFFKIRAYSTVGQNLKGKNVAYNIKDSASCWVYDNKYDFFEVPSNSNQEGWPYGEFLFLAYNKSFQYYLFGIMTVELDRGRTISTRYVTERVHFKNHGKFFITFEQYDNNIHKSEYGSDFDPGVPSDEHTFDFDSFNSRKIAYNLNSYKIIGKIDPSFKGTSDPNKIAGKNKVAIYNKKPNNNYKGKQKNKRYN